MFASATEEKTWDKAACTATHIYILLMLSLFPLFTGLDGYVLLQQKRFALFALLTAGWLLALTAGGIYAFAKGARPKPGKHEICLLLFVLCAALACALSPAGFTASLDTANHSGLVTYLLYALVIAGLSRFGRPRSCYIYAFAASYGASCAVAIVQLAGFNALWLYPGVMNYYSPYVVEMGRFLGTMGNVDIMSAYHCLAIPLLLGFAFGGGGRWRWLLLVPAAAGLVCALWAGVASGILALLCTLALMLPSAVAALRSRRSGGLSGADRKKTVLGTAAAVAALGLVALTAVCFLPFEGGTLYELQCLLRGQLSDDFGSGRIGIWRDCLRIVSEHPLAGIGPDRLLEYSTVEFRRYSDVLGETIVTRVDDAHNVYLQLLLNFGLLGALPFAAFAALTLRRIFTGGGAAWAPAVLCYMIQAFFNVSTCIIAPIACVAAGLVWAKRENENSI